MTKHGLVQGLRRRSTASYQTHVIRKIVMQEDVQQRLRRSAALCYFPSDVKGNPDAGRSDIVWRNNSNIGRLSSEGVLHLLTTGEIDCFEKSRNIDWKGSGKSDNERCRKGAKTMTYYSHYRSYEAKSCCSRRNGTPGCGRLLELGRQGRSASEDILSTPVEEEGGQPKRTSVLKQPMKAC